MNKNDLKSKSEAITSVKKDEKKPEFAMKNLAKNPKTEIKEKAATSKTQAPDIGKELKKINNEITPLRKATNDPHL